MEDKVVCSQEEYDALHEDSSFLQALKDAGVDNWEGFEDALERFNMEYFE